MKRWYPPLMNAPFSLSSSESERDIFDRLRLEMLDAFYRLDAALEDWIHDGGGKTAGASTGCRLKELTEMTFTPAIATKAQAARFAKLPGELEDVIRLRNLIVHSEASLGILEGNPAIFLRPVSHSMRANKYVATTNTEEIQNAIGRANLCARTLVPWRRQREDKAAGNKQTSVTDETA